MWQKYSDSEWRMQLYSFVPVITADRTALSAGWHAGVSVGLCEIILSGKSLSDPADFPVRESEDSAIRRAYQKRDLMVQRLGFVSLMRLKVFMAGHLP